MRPGRRSALRLAAVGAAAAVAGAFAGAFFLQSRSGAARLLSTSYRDLSGGERRLIDWQGMVLMVNFWATWCAPCRDEMPMFVAARQKYRASGVEFVGIGIDTAANIREFAKSYGISYPLLIADSGAIELMRSLGNRSGALPYTVVLDRSGSLVNRHLGPLSRSELDRILQSLLG